jgi:hypothetical protein
MLKFVCNESKGHNNVNKPFTKNVRLVRNFINADAFALTSSRVSASRPFRQLPMIASAHRAIGARGASLVGWSEGH